MTAKQSYTFVVLRYMHDVMTGEFVNVGVVMFAPQSRILKVRTSTSIARLRGVFPDLQRPAFTAAMKSISRAGKRLAGDMRRQDLFTDGKVGAAVLANRLVSPDDSSLQWSAEGGGISDNPEKTFDRLFGRLVERYNTEAGHKLTDDEVWRPVREKLAAKNVHIDFVEKLVVGSADEIEFKHAWKNGSWHAYEPLSFDLANADGIKEKARRWRGHLDAVKDGATELVSLNFVVAAPRHEALMPAFHKAIGILSKAAFAPTIYDEGKVDDLVDSIADEMNRHATPGSH